MMRTDAEVPKRLRVLAFHGFRTSATILEKQISRWDPAIHGLVEFSYLDGPFPARGESIVKDIFEGPYFEWMQHNENWTESYNYEESMAYVLNYMEKNGPFDGVLGFSQGAVQAGFIIACQKKVLQGKSAADLPPIRFFISINGLGHLRDPGIVDVYTGNRMDVPTLHLIGAKDNLREFSVGFLHFWKDPVVIEHPSGHTVPRLGYLLPRFLSLFVVTPELTVESSFEFQRFGQKVWSFMGSDLTTMALSFIHSVYERYVRLDLFTLKRPPKM